MNQLGGPPRDPFRDTLVLPTNQRTLATRTAELAEVQVPLHQRQVRRRARVERSCVREGEAHGVQPFEHEPQALTVLDNDRRRHQARAPPRASSTTVSAPSRGSTRKVASTAKSSSATATQARSTSDTVRSPCVRVVAVWLCALLRRGVAGQREALARARRPIGDACFALEARIVDFVTVG
jgi:hypothetical protein